jgi:WXG100 family type VII secretion target
MRGIRVIPSSCRPCPARSAAEPARSRASCAPLGSTVAPLVGGDWAGQAQQRFTALWEEWQRSAQGLKHALDGISQLMGQAGTAYQQAEQSIAGTFR